MIEYLNSRNFYGPFSMEVEYTGDFATKEKTEEDLVYVNAQVKSARSGTATGFVKIFFVSILFF